MNELYMMVTIVDRKKTKKFVDFYNEACGLHVAIITAGDGTAADELLDYFGLDGSDKAVMFHFVTAEKWRDTKRRLQVDMKIDIPGLGIVFIVPLSSIGGKKALAFLTQGQGYVKGEESELKDTKYELIVVISNQGYTEKVMDAARKAQARGGTVIHAKGTGGKEAEKFLGVTLVPEKEMVFIVARTERKNDIMKAIMESAGTNTKAGSIVFSLPVTDTAGMRLMEYVDDDEA